ncbi:hypothetical protein IGJ83_000375 [Enterococcus pernyi]
MTFCKKLIFGGLSTILLFQTIPFQLNQANADVEHSVDEEVIDHFRAYQPEYLKLSTSPDIKESEQLNDPIQVFSFVNKSFQTTVNQPVMLKFTSTLPTNEVLIRVPEEGEIVPGIFTHGESVDHSHGEYWNLKTQTVQNEFELPVVFNYTGQYFLSIDHDADHFYIEVTDDSPKIKISETEETESLSETNKVDVNNLEEITDELTVNQQDLVLPKIAQEMNLSIPKELIEMEENRILEETRNVDNRSDSTVSNWSQFRSAWNSSRTTSISVGHANIVFSSSILGDGLNTRSSGIALTGSTGTLNFLNSGNSLNIAGNLRLSIQEITAGSGATPPINVTAGNLIIEHARIINQRSTPAVSAPNMTLGVYPGGTYQVLIFNHQAVSPVRVINSGTIRIAHRVAIGSNAVSQNFIPPIESTSGTNIYINSSNFMMLGRTQLSGTTLRNLDAFSESWHSLDAHLTGVNGSVVRSSTSDPADFSERYLMNFGQSKYRSLISSATTGEGFDPPVSSYNLTLQTSPSEGGNPEVERTSLQQGATTTISANPNKGYTFSHWELVSGIGSSIASVISETTSFTMGTQNTVVRAIYEEEQEGKVHVYHTDMEGHELIEPVILTGSIGKTYQTSPIEFEHYQLIETPDNANGHFEEETISVVYTYDIENVNPLDPLDPEAEVEPENHPELPESQGLLSIDFVSQFNFGSQGISLHNQTYYAQPQRLLNEDGTVKEKEERPNYVQISDRRPDNERSGWQLSVTQNGQFSNQSGHELIGSEIQLLNQELVTAQGGTAPTLQEKTAQRIIPNTKKILLLADKESGTGTWIYRFGDQQTADKSVGLYIPKGTNPEATSYSTKLTWELSAVPDN